MADIKITPDDSQLEIKVTIHTPQRLDYKISILAANGNDVLKTFEGTTENPETHIIEPASAYASCYLMNELSVIDLAGAGNPFEVRTTVFQKGDDCKDKLITVGQSTAGAANKTQMGKFIMK